MGLQTVGHDWANSTFAFILIDAEKALEKNPTFIHDPPPPKKNSESYKENTTFSTWQRIPKESIQPTVYL